MKAPATRILAAAPAVLARYSWTRAAEETMRVIEEVGGRRGAASRLATGNGQ